MVQGTWYKAQGTRHKAQERHKEDPRGQEGKAHPKGDAKFWLDFYDPRRTTDHFNLLMIVERIFLICSA